MGVEHDRDEVRKIGMWIAIVGGALALVLILLLTVPSHPKGTKPPADAAIARVEVDAAVPVDPPLPNADMPDPPPGTPDRWVDPIASKRADPTQPFPKNIRSDRFIGRTHSEIESEVGIGETKQDKRVFYNFDDPKFIALRFVGDRCVGIEVLSAQRPQPTESWMWTLVKLRPGATVNGHRVVVRPVSSVGIALYDKAYVDDIDARVRAAVGE